MSQRKLNPQAKAQKPIREEELQRWLAEHPTPLAQKILAARREFLARNGRFLTVDEINGEIAEQRNQR